jgi:hypothetical protein
MDAETSKQDKAGCVQVCSSGDAGLHKQTMQQVLALDSKQFHIDLHTTVIWV